MSLSSGGAATVGTIQHEGVRYDSNTLNDAEMREVLEIPAPEAPATETPASDQEPDPEPAAEAAPAEPPATKDATPATDKAPKAKKNPQERIDRVVYEREEARREAAREKQAREEAERRYRSDFDQLRAELEALKRGSNPNQERSNPKQAQPDNADPEPKLEDFADQLDPYAAWMRASAKYDARQEFKAQQKQAQERYTQQQQEQRRQEREFHEHQRIQTWTQRMEAAFTKAPELRAQIEQMPILPRPMMDVIVDSEIPDQILSHLLRHPEEQSRIATLHPLQQFRELSRIEYDLEKAASLITGSAAPEKPKTSAHPPVSPVSGSHAAPKSSGEPGPDATYEEHKAYWNAREAEERKARR